VETLPDRAEVMPAPVSVRPQAHRPFRQRHWQLLSFLRDRAAVAAALVLLVVTGAAVLAPWLGVYDPYVANNVLRFAPPGTQGHLLGTDQQGRDMVARLVWGGRISLLVGVVPTVFASIIGLGLGLLAGYARGIVDHVIMRVLDVLFAFPMVLLAIAVAGVLTPGVGTEIISITIVLIPYVGRLARTATLDVVTMPYIEAARAAGGSHAAILTSYVLPNVFSPIVVYATTLMGLMIVVGSGLSFLGLGVQPPVADWGAMVADGRIVLRRAAHVTVLPGLAILTVSLAFNFLGDGLRDALDPRSGRK
jgi:ABC-type dipeptide/oligopeptide/nickel transport system permease subunit